MMGLLVVLGLVVSGCAPAAPAPAAPATDATAAPAAAGEAAAGAECAELQPVTLQLKWVAQAQFAGYYAAEGEGYYADECLDITINPGSPDIVPEQVVAGGQADFGINFVPSLLSAREQGTNLVNVAQIFERSAMREISWQDSNITSPEDLRDKRVAVWFGGNDF
jgi:NitT/TauT family transport system substrate-binding protein